MMIKFINLFYLIRPWDIPPKTHPTLRSHWNPSHVKNPSRSNGMGSTPPIAISSHGMGLMGRVHEMGYPISFQPLGRRNPFFFTIFVNKLVNVGSQSIASIVMEFTVVEFPIIFITVVVVPSFDRKISNWLFIPWNMV